MNAAAGESRKTIAAATSLSVPSRRSGTSVVQAAEGLAHLGRIVVEAARGDPARRDRVDAHRRPFERRGLGEVEHAGARRARVAHAGHAVPHVGDDVDDGAAARLPLPSSSSIHWVMHSRAIRKPPVRLLRTTASQPLALIVASGAGNWPPALLTRASMRPCAREHRGDGGLHRGLVADVAGVRRADAAGGLDLAAHRLELLELAADDRDARAERGELVRGAAADARAAAGDDGDLAGEQVGAKDGAVGGHRQGGKSSTKRLLGKVTASLPSRIMVCQCGRRP